MLGIWPEISFPIFPVAFGCAALLHVAYVAWPHRASCFSPCLAIGSIKSANHSRPYPGKEQSSWITNFAILFLKVAVQRDWRVKAQSNALTYPSTHISTEEAQRIDRLLEPVLVGDLCIVLPFFQTSPFAIHASNWRHVVSHARMESALCFLRQKAVMQCDPIETLNSGYSLLVQRA